MDDDHDRLETLLRQAPHTADADLPRLLDELEVETRAHFAREEELMRAHSVPVLDCHMVQHRLFLAEFDAGRAAVLTRDMAALRDFLQWTLPQLFAQHVDTVDRVTAGFLRDVASAAMA
jgi:hemerythrin-like metal-binding protein